MRTTTIQFATALQAHARVNQLQALLGLPLTAASHTIDGDWDLVEELEGRLAANPVAPSATPALPTPTKQAPTKAAPPIVALPELRGVARAAAAQRDGRTAKPTLTASTTPLTGVMRAAAAQEKLNRTRQS